MKNVFFSLIFIFSTTLSFAQSIATFEEFNLPLDTFLNGSDGQTVYSDGAINFPTFFNGTFWLGGWAISTMRDDSTSGYENLYSAFASRNELMGSGSGVGFQSKTYAIGQQNAIIQMNGNTTGKVVNGFYITNTTYAYNSMRDGDSIAKKFGGTNGTDPDFFKLEIQKYSNGELAPQVVEFYLADFRSDDSNEDYIVNDWQWVDLTSLGNVDSLQFTLNSSDIGNFGINTPLFFAIDNLEISEEISTSNENIILTSEQIKFYPNPVINEIILEVADTKMVGNIQVFDMLGRQLIQQAFDDNQPRIDVTNLEFGTYILQVVASDGQYFSSTFVKK